MSESGMNFEQPKITDAQVIEALRTFETDPASAELFQRWAEEQRQTIDAIVVAQGEIAAEVPIIEQYIHQVELYVAAGMIEYAFERIDETVACLGRGEKFDEVTSKAVALHGKIQALRDTPQM